MRVADVTDEAEAVLPDGERSFVDNDVYGMPFGGRSFGGEFIRKLASPVKIEPGPAD